MANGHGGKRPGAGGKVTRYPVARLRDLQEKLAAYIETATIPTIHRFAYDNKITRSCIYDHPEYFEELQERLINKKVANCIELGANGGIVPSMAIFQLKQHGFSDRQDVRFPEGVTVSSLSMDDFLKAKKAKDEAEGPKQ
jgi:hypothetical protein